MSRNQCIFNGGGCNFSVADNPNADGGAPWYEISAISPIEDYALTIEMSANAFKVDQKLIGSIIFTETTHGYYDVLISQFDMNKSIAPININVDYWGYVFGKRDYISNRYHNIGAGAKIHSAIKENMPNASIYQNATL